MQINYGYRGTDAIQKAYKEFVEKKKENIDTDNEILIEEMEEEAIDDGPGGNKRSRRTKP